MSASQSGVSHARELVASITQADDGAHAIEMLRLIHEIADPNKVEGLEVKKYLYTLTEDFDLHFNAFLKTLGALIVLISGIESALDGLL